MWFETDIQLRRLTISIVFHTVFITPILNVFFNRRYCNTS